VLSKKINHSFLIFHYLKKVFIKIQQFYVSKVIKQCGSHFRIYGSFYLQKPQKLIVGNNVTINDGVYINARGGITVGNDVSFSAGCKIVSTGLDVTKDKLNQSHIDKPIFIGNNVQIGTGAIILMGITIGDDVIIGAGSVVTKDIESNCIVVGNPAKILKKLKSENE